MILCICIFGTFAYGQITWFVSPSGTDSSGSGTSISNPFQSINYAVSYLSAGDTLNIMPGTYQNASFGNVDFFKNQSDCAIYINELNGTNSQYITIRSYTPNSVVLKGDGLATVLIKNSSYIRLEGIESYGETENIPLDTALQYQFLYKDASGNLQYRLPPHTPDSIVQDTTLPLLSSIDRPTYFNTHGIIVSNAHHIEVVGNLVHHMPGEGIRSVNSDYITISKNEVHNCSRRSSTGVHGISLYTMASIDTIDAVKVVMSQNVVHHNYNEVYSWSERNPIINPHIDEGKGLTVQRCTFARGWKRGKIRIENNIAYHNGFAGVQINEGERVEIVNNTLYYNTFTSSITGGGNQHGISAQSGSNNIEIFNNIIVADTLLTFGRALNISSNSTGVTIEDNMVVGSLNSNANAIDINTIFENPQFVNAASNDFSLQPSSPAIGMSDVVKAPLNDHFDNVRDASPDLGAIEYLSPLPIELLFFEAQLNSRKEVLLTWSTLSETNNDFFSVEKSLDGIEWNTIKVIQAAGNSIDTRIYEEIDPVPEIGKLNYYRLKQTDVDGTYTYSSIRAVVVEPAKQPTLNCYPNPTSGLLFIEGVNDPTTQLMIYNMYGKQITTTTRSELSNGKVLLDCSSLPNGTYLIIANTEAFRVQIMN